MTQFDKQPCRPRNHLIDAGRLYPQAWRMADQFRADRGTNGLPAWPEWCYLPMAAWYAVVSADIGVDRLGPQHLDVVGDVARLAALGAWRCTQGIYRFDPALYDAVRETPIGGDLPHDMLYRLPEWCIYIETPGLLWGASPLHGVFAHLEWDANTGRAELRLVMDSATALDPLPLHIGPWTLAESIHRMADVAAVQSVMAGVPVGGRAEAISGVKQQLEPVISLLLYLCSEASEIGTTDKRPANPQPKRTKAGWRMFPAERLTTWEVGVRIGAALRRAYHAEQTGVGGTHAGPRPHIRRAHWHGFRSGPTRREDGTEIPTGERQFALRWLPPIPVNVDDVADLPSTIRPVK